MVKLVDKQIKVLIHTQYYFPEIGAPQTRLSELGQELKNQGFSVTVLTALPNYPFGKVFPNYKGVVKKETLDGVVIYRSFIYPTKKISLIPRVSSYFSFVLSSFMTGLFIPKLDIILTESPPLFLGISGYLLCKIKRSKWILNISDLWPQSVVELGVIDRNSRLFKISNILEGFLYRKAWLVTGQSQTIINNIHGRYPQVNTYHLSNGVNPEKYDITIKEKDESTIHVLYAGLHGIAQGLEQIIEAARGLKEFTYIKFILVGEGPMKESLKELADHYGLNNIKFCDPVEKSSMPGLLASSDIIIVPLKKQLTGAVPSKLYEGMAASKPIILIAESEAAEIVKASDSGIVIKPGDVSGMQKAILDLAGNFDERLRLGNNGHAFVKKNFNQKIIAQDFCTYLKVNLLKTD